MLNQMTLMNTLSLVRLNRRQTAAAARPRDCDEVAG
jgi:hypothetical protein